MDRTLNSGSNKLKIDVAAPPRWDFAGGDTIIGQVVRRSPVVATDATLSLVLLGRVKTKITSGDHSYYDSWELLEIPQELFRGPLHLSQDSSDPLSWEFEVEIPTGPDPSVASGHSQKESFLSIDKDAIASHTLPATVSVDNGVPYGACFAEGVVVYCLHATLRHTRDSLITVDEAFTPIILRHPKPETPLTEHQLQRRVAAKAIRTQRLLPGMEHADLTFRQRAQKAFHSSKVPELRFDVEMTMPRAVQLDNPLGVPLTLRMIPQPTKTSAVVRDNVHLIRLDHVALTIKTRGSLIAPGNFISIHEEGYTSTYELGLERAFQSLSSPVKIPCGEGQKSLVNIGNMLQLVLRSDGLYSGERRLAQKYVCPEFLTYSISHMSSTLYSEMSLTVAEETIMSKFSTPLRIIAAG